MRDIAAQNMAMRELLMQAQGHQRPQGSYLVQEIPLSHSRGHTSRHTERPLEREGNTEATSYAQESHPSEPLLGDNFPQEHDDQRSVSVFDRIGNDPSTRVRPARGLVWSDREEEHVPPPPRNRRERRNLVDWDSRGEALPPPQDIQDDEGSKGPCRSYEIDDDDDNLPFSREIRSFPMPTNFMPPKIPKYEGKGDPEKHLTKYMTQMSLRGASPALKCRAFHLTLGGAVEVWYSRLPPLSIRSWPNLKKAFLNQYLSRREGEAPIQRLQDMRQAPGETLKSTKLLTVSRSLTGKPFQP